MLATVVECHPIHYFDYNYLGQQTTKQIILPQNAQFGQNQQIIQIQGQNGQPSQMIIVPQGQIILLPTNNDQGTNGIRTLQRKRHKCILNYLWSFQPRVISACS